MRGWIKKGVDAYLDFRSFKTDRRLVIIESDDWGSLRTMDKKTRDKLNKISAAVEMDRFTQLDNIASADDLTALFDVLNSVRDSKGNPACITANVCTANPDFEAIKATDFEEFHYTFFTQTLKEFDTKQGLLKIWKNGESNKLFMPQLHGREHVHALQWLAELRLGNKDLIKAFELHSFGIPYKALIGQRRSNLQAALDIYSIEGEEEYHEKWIKDSTEIFEKVFGYSSQSFISPAYTWHINIHKCLAEAKVKTLQGIKLQYEPTNKTKVKYRRKPHYTGEVDKKSKLIYTTRNAFFEPAAKPDKDWVNATLQGVEKAFKIKQPAIIGSHRINYIGSLEENNRKQNLAMLKSILKKIVAKYPDVEFMDSGSLANIVCNYDKI